MISHFKLEFVPVENAVKIWTGTKKYLIAQVVSDEEHTHRANALLVLFLKLFLVFFQLS